MAGRFRRQPPLPEGPERNQVVAAGRTIGFTIVRSTARVRTIAISVGADGEPRVAVPAGTPLEEIRRIVAVKAAWIAKRQALIAAKPARAALAAGCSLPFLGDELTLDIVSVQGRRGTANQKGQRLELRVPEALEFEESEEFVQELLRLWYRLRAEEYLRKRVALWAPIVGRPATAIHVRDQKRLWGSCSPTGALRFNFRLAMVGPELVDYVVVHELAHIVHGNHGPKFWALVERALPDHKERRAQLRGLTERLPV